MSARSIEMKCPGAQSDGLVRAPERVVRFHDRVFDGRGIAAVGVEVVEMSKDPVCGMSVDEKSAHKSTHAGQTYLFCSPGCKVKFDKEPARYTSPVAKEEAPGARRT